MFRLGKYDFNNPIVLAPMEDVTDIAFRLICKELGADIVYTEFVNSEGLVRNSKKTHAKMEFVEAERPFGIQIYGGEELSMESATKIVDSYDPDIIDINCGCWVKNVVGAGAGAGLLRDIPKMERLVSAVVKATNKPVTVKTRLGWDSESIKIVDVAKMLEQAGVKLLTIHCRTRAQGHKGEPDFSWIPKVKKEVSIPLFVNGSLDTPQRIAEVFGETGCDGVMVARGAIDNPWIFGQTKLFLATGVAPVPVSTRQRIDLMLRHLELSVQHKGDRKGVIEFRKHYAGYMKGLPNAAKFRMAAMSFTSHEEVVSAVKIYAEYLAAEQPVNPMSDNELSSSIAEEIESHG